MSICVYGASADHLAEAYREDARRLGELIAQAGRTLVFGGGQTGLMGECARGALDRGGQVVGVAPRFFDEPGVLLPQCSRMIFTDTMRERKQIMEESSRAFIALPGGIGTLEEFFEILTLKQLGRHRKPIALLNTLGYYDSLQALLEQAAEQGFMSRSCLALCALCPSPESALAHALREEPPAGGARRLSDYHA